MTVDNEDYENYEYTGIPMPGTKYFIQREKDSECGEIFISDPSLMIGYLNNEEETNRSIVNINNERYMRMGDLFSDDDLERLYFQGRIKRTVMRPDGHTVHVTPIEDVLNNSGLVEHCCVVGVKKKDGSAGAIPTAFVVLKAGLSQSKATALELDKLSLSKLSERNRALSYVFVDEIPRTLMDKDNFKLLENHFIEDLPFFPVDYTFFEL